jgi:[CysO sulfur-carrier protein]-S-L-cysteine hydrolase
MKIAPDLLQLVIDHAVRDAPDEACGLIFLRDGVAEEVLVAENEFHSPFRFKLPGPVTLKMATAEDEGRDVIIYHSHTRSEPRPSQTDITFGVNWPGVEWLIVGLADGAPEVRNWRIEPDGSYAEAEVEVTADASA